MFHRNWQASVCVPCSQVVVPTALPALGTGIVFILEGLLAAQAGPSRVGCDAGVDHMGISLQPSSCSSVLPLQEPYLVLLRSAASVGLKAALIGSLFVAKTRSGANVVDSYTLGCHRVCCMDFYWNAILNLCEDTHQKTCPTHTHTHTPGCLGSSFLNASFSRSSLHPASACVLPLTNGARQLVFLH